MNRFYLLPKIGTGSIDPFDPFRPKYTDPDSLGAGWNIGGRWVAMDYGIEDCFLMRIHDITPEEHTALNSQTDVIGVPSPLSDNVSAAALSVIQTRLEGMNIPANWVTTSHTYLQVLKAVRRAITFMQRFHGLYVMKLFQAGITLDTQINQLTQAQRGRLIATADSLNLDTSGITNQMTIRQALKQIADQLPDVNIGGDTI